MVIDFSDEMSNLCEEAFVRLLRENLTIQKIVVGQNFRCGKKRTPGNDDLREILSVTGIELLTGESVNWRTRAVSRPRVRDSIASVRTARA